MGSRNLTRLVLYCCLLVCFIEGSHRTPAAAQSAMQNNKSQAERDYRTGREIGERGNLLAAKTQLERALKIYQHLGDRLGQYNCQIELARIDYKLAKYTQAQSRLRLATQVNNYRHRHDGRAKTLQGLIALELGDYRDAVNYLNTGIHELRVYGNSARLDRQTLTEAQIALGEAYFYQGQYRRAEQHLLQTLRVSSLDLRRRAYNALGQIQLELGLYEEARLNFTRAAGVANTTGDRLGKVKTLANLGRVDRLQGNNARALKQYQQALSQLRGLGAWSRQVFVLNNLGLLAMDLGLNHRALEYFHEAEATLTSSGRVGQVITYTNLGYYYSRRKKYDLAIDYLERALDWAASNGDRLGTAKALAELGEIELLQQRYRRASDTLEASIEIYESLRPGLRDEQKISLAEGQRRTYDALQRAYVAQNKPNDALVIAERGRARAFIELLAQKTAEHSQLELDITPPGISQIKAIAKNRQATLVNYSIIEDRQGEESQLYIWVINPQGRIDFRQLNLPEIKQKFSTSVASVARNSRRAAAGGLDLRNPRLQDYIVSVRGELRTERAEPSMVRHKLGFPRDAHKMLIAPIADLLPDDPEELVVFVPQDTLFLLPFPALQNEAGEFLIERHTIQISPSLQSLAVRPTVDRLDTSNALVVGNPAPMPDSLSPLVGAEAEAKAIAEILATTPMIGTAATEAKAIAKMQQAKLIHLATHGLFDEHQGLQSSLAFSAQDDSEGSGLLTAEEILDLNLAADLVVLSACNTGRGQITGDGVVGLSRSFLLAGAQNTMVSLWYVPDLATSTLAIDFYKQLQGNLPYPQALRRAMLNTMQTHPAPRDWAGFILVGQ